MISVFDLNTKLIISNAGPRHKSGYQGHNYHHGKDFRFKTPKSYPMFNATSSIKPRVFINAPIVKLSFRVLAHISGG